MCKKGNSVPFEQSEQPPNIQTRNRYRRLNTILLLSQEHSVTTVSKILVAARSSIGRWIHWYTECGIDGLESSTRGRTVTLPFLQVAAVLIASLAPNPQSLGYQR